MSGKGGLGLRVYRVKGGCLLVLKTKGRSEYNYYHKV